MQHTLVCGDSGFSSDVLYACLPESADAGATLKAIGSAAYLIEGVRLTNHPASCEQVVWSGQNGEPLRDEEGRVYLYAVR